MGLMVLRWGWGAQRFEDLARTIVKFLDYTKEGTKFVFGFVANPPNVCGMFPVFVFSVLQTLIYFGSIVAVLYYYGIIQFVLRQVATLVRATLTTTAAESLQACACVFLGMTEGPLLIQPYIDKMTASELHAILTSNFSCIAGTLFAAYISLGACPNYLLSSSIMSAPGSLACSKLLFPETEESHLKDIKDLELPRGSETTALECLSNGASATVQIVFSIGANLLVVIAFLAFFDDVIGYLGELVGIYGLSFQMLLGYLFFPLAYLMGVTDDLNETLHVAQLMGTKTALNEFIAYQKLGELTASNLLTPKAAMIATYALCGFSNFSAVGMQLEFLGLLVFKKFLSVEFRKARSIEENDSVENRDEGLAGGIDFLFFYGVDCRNSGPRA
ncbi:hypothetical protein WR25_23015 isoform D [Diploscapter pachys]|uniref:Concentrative nucleoside transporter C-terminal domain-containing protein n=1 Tax=Diploscapter pachys TaxID=2018661 RepID=A0A2A2KYW1_9BILA|nr:hypothetical protein WR25_23015 isoform D [Diploscapter pachys]